ncbi:hypothetical protein C5167_005010 [Papaver somniferum]|uniref:Peptidase A1 domain-containing protein n=1 Tax=Papaver somniferum TaxID=3469 RepID=A0A4Y7JCS9_PAPSO|nr:hypothetical protein C5167_005010 [Papaver somniferum]
MGSSSFASYVIQFPLLLFFLVSFSSAANDLPSFSNIIFNLDRDPLTLQYRININQGTPLATVKLVLDFSGKLSAVFCNKGAYTSSSYQPIKCMSPQCSLASKPVTCVSCNGTQTKNSWCHKNACSISTRNPVTRFSGKGELVSDVVYTESIYAFGNEGYIRGPIDLRPISFGCATTSNFLKGLGEGAKGVAGLGRSSRLSLVSQFSAAFPQFRRTFALDLSGLLIYFGGGPYIYSYGTFFGDLSKLFHYAPLLVNPKSKEEYFVDVKSVKIHGKTVPIDKKLLSINKTTGVGGAKIDILKPYTVLETSIYKALIKVHTKWAKGMNVTRVTPVAPFGACYKSSTIPPWTSKPGSVAFIFPKSEWRIVWRDLVSVNNDAVRCLGFVDGGLKPKTSIVIGAHQLGWFMEFDTSRSRWGFLQPESGQQ